MIKVGRKHGNGYHGNVYQKFEVAPSERVINLINEELEQLERGNIIHEREFLSSWIKRTCPRCFNTYMEQCGEIYICPKCDIKKIPKGVEYLE